MSSSRSCEFVCLVLLLAKATWRLSRSAVRAFSIHPFLFEFFLRLFGVVGGGVSCNVEGVIPRRMELAVWHPGI